MTSEATMADIAVVACAELFRGDGEILASPMGLVPSIGARLARLTFEPDLLLTDGEATLLADTPPLGGEAGAAAEGWQPFRAMLGDVVPGGRRHVVMGANQVDRHGNQNISAIGGHARPSKQLLGVRGAPGNTVNHRTSYWVPRHSPRVLVGSVDVVSGVGHDRAGAAGTAASRFHDVHRVVSNLAVLDFGGPGGTMRVVSAHPGVGAADIAEATAFPLAGPDSGEASATRLPTDRELELIRWLDPKGSREKEVPS